MISSPFSSHLMHQYAPCLAPQVLMECSPAMTIHQDELLQEVSRIMAQPSRNNPASARAKQASMELLRHFGRAGQDALRAARQNQYGLGGGPPYPFGGVAPGMQPGQMPAAPRDPGEGQEEQLSLLHPVVGHGPPISSWYGTREVELIRVVCSLQPNQNYDIGGDQEEPCRQHCVHGGWLRCIMVTSMQCLFLAYSQGSRPI